MFKILVVKLSGPGKRSDGIFLNCTVKFCVSYFLITYFFEVFINHRLVMIYLRYGLLFINRFTFVFKTSQSVLAFRLNNCTQTLELQAQCSITM